MIKKKSRSKLIKALDGLWSNAVRRKYPVCVVCGSDKYLSSHHVVCRKGMSDHVRWIVDNGITLCAGCHLFKLHKGQADLQWLKRFINIVDSLVTPTAQLGIIASSKIKDKYKVKDLERLIKEFDNEEDNK